MGQLATDPPDVLNRNRLQPTIRITAATQIKQSGMGRHLFGQAVGQFRLTLAGADSDGNRQA